MSLPYKIAFIGAGAMSSAHMMAFKDIEGVDLSGLASRTAAKVEALAKEYGVKNVCASIEELYERTKADLTVISVPVLETYAVCKEAFKYPWKLLIEKPVGYDVDEAILIQQAANEYGREAFVALNRRHYASTLNMMDGLRDDDAPRMIHVFDQEDIVAARAAGQPDLVVKNWMYANSIHMIDFFSIFGRGEIVSVAPVIAWNPEYPSFVSSRINFSSGDIGLYNAVWNSPGPWAVAVTTHSTRWEMRPVEQVAVQRYPSRTLEPLLLHAWDSAFKPGLRRQAEEALKAIKGEQHNLVSLAEGVETMKLVQSIYAV